MEQTRTTKIIVILAVTILTLVSIIGVSMAYFSIQVTGNENASSIRVGTALLRLTYTDNLVMEALEVYPGWSQTKTISVENTGTDSVYYNIIWRDLLNEIINDELIMSATCSSNVQGNTCSGFSNIVIPTASPEEHNAIIKSYIGIDPGERHTYTITVLFEEMSIAQNYNQGKRFRGVINVSEGTDTTYSISITNGYGISSLSIGGESGTSITKNLHPGDTIDLSEIAATYTDDFSGKKFVITDGEGRVNRTKYTVGEGDATIMVDPSYPRKCYCNDGRSNTGTICDIGAFTYRYKYKATATGWSTMSDNGWGVKLIDKNSTAPVTETMCAYINDKPLVNTMHAFTSSNATSIDVSNYYTKNINQMTYMFREAKATKLIGISNFDLSNVSNAGGMFFKMTNLRVLDLTNWDTSNVTNFNVMFQGASSLETIYTSNSFVVNASSVNKMFLDCSSLVGGMGTPYDESEIGVSRARIDGGIGNEGYFTQGPPPTN